MPHDEWKFKSGTFFFFCQVTFSIYNSDNNENET